MKQWKAFGYIIFFGILWWGLMYPELCLVEGTYEKAAVECEDREDEADNAFEDFRKMLEEGPGAIRFKMKIAGRQSQ